jgi:hypothetical protein
MDEHWLMFQASPQLQGASEYVVCLEHHIVDVHRKFKKRSKQRDEDKWISATDVYTYVSRQIPHYFNC